MKKRHRKRLVLGSREEDILKHLSAGDLLMSVLLSGRSTRVFYREAQKRAHARYRDKQCIEGLERKGLVSKKHGGLISLSPEGKELIAVLESNTDHLKAAWKGRWWLVLYDIPVSASPFRFALRRTLIRGGFRKLQHSVWVHPHRSRELELFLKQNPKMIRYVRYVETLPFVGLKTIADWKKLSLS